MTAFTWVALGICLASIVGGGFYAGASALRAWRSFRRVRRKLSDGLAEITRRVAAIERRMGKAGESAARLERANAELQESLATARVLAAAYGEFRATLSRVTGIVPSK